MENFKQKLKQIKAFIFDVDGVLTDSSVILLPTGEQVRTMNIKDGYAMKLAADLGYKIAIISGGKNEAVVKRLNGLGIYDVYMGCSDKIEAYNEFLATYNYNTEDILYMGDDMPDYDVMRRVGIATCPNDAIPDIKALSLYVSPKNGGQGCVRDILEQVLRLNNQWYNKEYNALNNG